MSWSVIIVTPASVAGSWTPRSHDLAQQALGLPLQGQDVGADVVEGAEGLGLVEVAGEADFVAGLDGGRDVPCVGRVGQHLSAEEGLDAAFFQERHLLGVAEVGVGLVLDDGGPAVDGGGEEAAQGVGVEGFLVDLLDYGRRGLGARTLLPQRLDLPGVVGSFGVDALQSQGPLDGDLAVAEGLIGEYLGLLGVLEGEEGVADAADVHVGQLAVLVAEVLCGGAGTTEWRR